MAGFLIQFISVFVLALWVGGGAAIGFLVAPIVFEQAGSRRLAGDILGRILRRFDGYVLAAGPIAFFATLLQVAGTVGGGKTLFLKLSMILGMVGLAMYARWALSPDIAKLRSDLGDALDQIPSEDPRRREFARLHGFSAMCLLGQIVLGAFAIALSVMTYSTKVG